MPHRLDVWVYCLGHRRAYRRTRGHPIQSAELNGEPLDGPHLAHRDAVAGGSLVITLGPEPNKHWGATVTGTEQ